MTSQSDSKVTETLSLQLLLQLIPNFETEQTSQVYRFIRSCDSAFSLASIPQQELLLVYALNKITGPSSSDVHIKQYKNWPELKTYLIQKFSQTKTLAHLNLELQTMFQKPSETVTEYYHRVDLCRNKILEKLSTEVTDTSLSGRKLTTEETALNVFINGLSSDIGIMLRTKEFKSLCNAGNFAMQEEKIRKMNNARQALISTSKTPLRSTVPKSIPNNHNPPPVFFQQRTLKICNYCKNPGHLISECRKRQYNNNQLRTSFTQNQRIQPSRDTQNINHLNSQAAVELSTSTETASTHYSSAQTPSSNLNTQELNHGVQNIQFQ